MTNTITTRIFAGMATFGLAIALFLAVPHDAKAGGYSYGGGSNCGCGYSYNGGGYTYNNGGYSYGNDHQSYQYPPAPNYYTIPSVQVTYANGYYQNYFVPTVRYFPAPFPVAVPTTYYPTQPPVFTYPGGYRNW
ncbi:MAG: hypothetical protein JWO00_13 [Candidatus Parcubacteria bacterium]|nr:hypothetical protein [Candidatus Parcubacteria bacterium]